MDKAERARFEAELRTLYTAERWEEAIDRAISAYGPEMCHFLMGMLHNEAAVEDAFQEFCIEMVKGLPGFEWRCTFRVWCYHLARGVGCKALRAPERRRGQRLNTLDQNQLAARSVAEATAEWRKTATRHRLWEACRELPERDWNLMVLRVEQKMSWVDIARVLREQEGEVDDVEALKKHAAALRKRFERIKSKLREIIV